MPLLQAVTEVDTIASEGAIHAIGMTPIALHAAAGNIPSVLTLLRNRADPRIKTESGMDAIAFANVMGVNEAMIGLLETGTLDEAFTAGRAPQQGQQNQKNQQ